MAMPTSVVIDGREFIPKTPAANAAWTLGEYLRRLREARGLTHHDVARDLSLSAYWLALVEGDYEPKRLPFWQMVRLARYYRADMELFAACYEATPIPPADADDGVADDETDEVHDNESAVVTDYLGLVLPEEPDHG